MPLACLSEPRWLTESGSDSDVVLSTRCRLARNLADAPFPWRASERDRREAALAVLSAVDGAQAFVQDARISRDDIDDEVVRRLVETRYCSADWWRPGTARWLCAARDGVRSLLVNEEDHLRLQAILPGLQVESCLDAAHEAERQLALRLEYAWESDIGFLTTSLRNAGTGLRLSVMLHLPALSAGDRLDEVLRASAELGSSVRGAFGEGSNSTGALYQVSNARASQLDAQKIAERVRASTQYLVEAERAARSEQFGNAAGRQRLQNAANRVIELLVAEDATQPRLLGMVSLLRLAASEGVIPVDRAECAVWITIAGAAPAPTGVDETELKSAELFEAIQRTAAIRGRVRRALGGTFTWTEQE